VGRQKPLQKPGGSTTSPPPFSDRIPGVTTLDRAELLAFAPAPTEIRIGRVPAHLRREAARP